MQEGLESGVVGELAVGPSASFSHLFCHGVFVISDSFLWAVVETCGAKAVV